MDEPPTATDPTRNSPVKPLAVILVTAAIAVAFCRLNPWFDNATRVFSTIIACGLTATALVVWALRHSGLGRRTKTTTAILLVTALVLFAAAMRTKYKDGDLHLTFMPRNWVLNLARRAGIDVGDVIHAARSADPPLIVTPSPDDSPRFFGPHGDGTVHFEHGRLVRDWTKSPPIERWRVKVGPGWSSFAVVGGYAFTQQQTTDLARELVVGYDLRDGAIQWVHADEKLFTSSMGGDGPRATPTFYQGKLVTAGGTGLLNCLDAATGRRLWSHDAMIENGAALPDWGIASSPLVFASEKHGDLVVQSVGGAGGKSLQAYRLEDGREVWSVGDDPTGYCSPRLHTLGGVRQIILVNWQAVTGHDPETGRELWRYDDWAGGQPKVPQPVVLDDRRVFISSGYGVGCVMLEVTRGDDGRWNVESKWKSLKLKPKFNNPVVRDGFVYGLDDGEFLVCLDLKNGDLKWRSQRGAGYGHGQLLLVDDLLLVQSETGDVALVKADPAKYEELTRFTVLPVGTSWNVPVLTGKRLLVRNEVEAACYELPTE